MRRIGYDGASHYGSGKPGEGRISPSSTGYTTTAMTGLIANKSWQPFMYVGGAAGFIFLDTKDSRQRNLVNAGRRHKPWSRELGYVERVT
jgi:hypothetical protein